MKILKKYIKMAQISLVKGFIKEGENSYYEDSTSQWATA